VLAVARLHRISYEAMVLLSNDLRIATFLYTDRFLVLFHIRGISCLQLPNPAPHEQIPLNAQDWMPA